MAAVDTFHLIIASVGQTRFDGAAASAALPGAEGVFEILPHHEPIVATLKAGTISVKKAGGETENFSVESGVLECAHNRATVLL